MSNESVSSSIIDNLVQVMSIATRNARHQASGIEKQTSSLRYFTGCLFPFFNGVFSDYKNNEPEVLDDLEKATRFFTDKQVPFIWWWTQQTEIPSNIMAYLDANGFQCPGDFLGIAARLNDVTVTDSDEQIDVRIVTNEEDYQCFLDILCDVFQLPETIKLDFKAMYQSYGSQGKFRHYLGYYAGEPAATLTRYLDGSVAGLYNGATLAPFQKHGLCTALADYAIKDALSSGCHYTVSQLMAPGMAKGMSEKMGFQTHCLIRPFLKDPR